MRASFENWQFSTKNRQNLWNKPQAAPLRFAPRRRGGGLEGICRAEVDSRTAASPRGETIAVQQWQRISWSGNARRPLATLTWVKEEGEGHIALDVLRWTCVVLRFSVFVARDLNCIEYCGSTVLKCICDSRLHWLVILLTFGYVSFYG